MLPEMARQILDGHVQIQKLSNQRMFLRRKSRFGELALGGFLGIHPAPGWNQRRDAREILFREAQHFTDVAHRRAASISDDVGGHGCAELSVTRVNKLDDALALIAAG